jgi:exo-1,4-beta-D-glucosaminidase
MLKCLTKKSLLTSSLFNVLFFLLLNFIPSSTAKPNILKLEKGWLLQSSENINTTGEVISSNEYSPENWFKTIIPSTVLGTLVKNNVYQDVFLGRNLETIFKKQFEKSWWYRTEFFTSNSLSMKNVELEFDGVIYRANVWLNGKQIAHSNEMFGAFRRFQFNISSVVDFNEKNILAVEIFPPEQGEPTVGFVDWNPKPPDNNMGIWREVRLIITGNASITSPFVKSKINLETLKNAELTISAEVINNTNQKISAALSGEIGSIKFSKDINLQPNKIQLITFTPQEFNELKLNNPRIWWIHSWGKPELYHLKLQLTINGKVSDEIETEFGIREVSDYINKDGYRGYKLNGKEVLIVGGGWVDQLFLEYDARKLEHQIQYIKHMGLNAIRLEGIWGNNQELYNLCARYGILLMVGWSCQWEWDEYIGKPHDEFGAIKTTEDMELIALSWKDQIKWLRNHPSIFVWVAASDKLPRSELEKEYLRILKEVDPTRPYLSTAGNRTSEILGPSAVKMNGPYEYVPPIYWSIDTQNGGAFGFNTETGPGPQVPPLESIKKMIPTAHLWPIDSIWNYHCGKNKFSNLEVYNTAMNNRLGKPNDLTEYVTKAQFMNYEWMRAMFEAFTANKPLTTGIIQWMHNAAWPKLWWQLYDYYLMPNGAFYGAKKALEPLHIQYDYKNHAINVVNNTLQYYDSLKASVMIFNADNSVSQKYWREEFVILEPNESKKILMLPQEKDIEGLTADYFLSLKLYNPSQEVVSTNFYSLSTKPDIMDFPNSGWYITPVKGYADLIGLNKLEKVSLSLVNRKTEEHKLNYNYRLVHEEDKEMVEVEFVNKADKIAFNIELGLKKGKEGESILPIFWDDNYFSLLPAEERTVKGYFYKEDLNGNEPYLHIAGWNIISEK